MTSFRAQTPEPTRRRSSVLGRSPLGQRVESEVKFLQSSWIPPNPKIVRAVRELLDQSPAPAVEQVVDLLRQDMGLMLWLCRQVGRSNVSEVRAGSPLDQLKSYGVEALKQLMDRANSQFSHHVLAKVNRNQSIELQLALSAGVAAEQLAESAGLNKDDALVLTYMRSIGRNLVAWNYPVIFSKGCAYQRLKRSSIDDEIRRSLSVGSLQISRNVLEDCRMSQSFKDAMILEAPDLAVRMKVPEQPVALAEICAFAELFSQTLCPDQYPDGDVAFQAARELMPESLRDINTETFGATLAGRLQSYADYVPLKHRVQVHAWVETAEELRVEHTNTPNKFIATCDYEVQDLFKELYEKIEQHHLRIEALQMLVNVVLPQTGFRDGCLYVLAKDGDTLLPQLRLGPRALNSYAPVRLGEDSSLARALFSNLPVREDLSSTEGGEYVSFSSGLNDSTINAVLYLEGNAEQFEDSMQAKSVFCAVREAFIDALGVRTEKAARVKKGEDHEINTGKP